MRKRIAELILIIVLAGFTQVFASDQARIVYIAGSGNGKKYHLESCRTLKNSAKVEITVEDAKGRGYTPCGVCRPGD
jgi:competence protein ComEC